MDFELAKGIEILERTPSVLKHLLINLSDDWVLTNKGPNTWSPFDVLGHLIHGEKTDWIPRTLLILSENTNKLFETFDRFAQEKDSEGKKLSQLLAEFEQLRIQNILTLKALNLNEADLHKQGQHPALGMVTLKELLATWVVHDLNHLGQIASTMAEQFRPHVGPWVQYLGILNK